MIHEVYWRQPMDAQPAGSVPSHSDVAVIGAGFAGLAVARDLLDSAPGLRVVVFDANYPGYGASGRNAGSVLPLTMPMWLLRGGAGPYDGRELQKLLYDRVHEQMRKLRDDAPEGEAQPVPLAMLATNRVMDAALKRTAGAIAASGIPVDVWSGDRVSALTSAPARNAVVLDAWTIQPAAMATALAAAVTKAGGEIHSGVAVVAVEAGSEKVTLTLRGGRRVDADRVVVATGGYTDGLALPDPPKAKVKHTYMRASEPLAQAEVAALGGPGIFMAAPGSGMPYWRVHGERLLFGGVDIRGLPPGDVADRFARGHLGVDRLLSRRLPGHRKPAAMRWGGPMHVTSTETPYIAKSALSDRVVYALGFAGSGVALTQTCGPLVRDLVLGPDFADPAAVLLREGLQATRIPWRGLGDFVLNNWHDVR